MALLQYRNIVNYEAQQGTRLFIYLLRCIIALELTFLAAFEDFLQKFKTSPEETLTHAIGQISIDEDDLSDEYDFMDEDEAPEQRRKQKAASKQPRQKYADMMQKLADRSLDEVLIELDDIVTASFFYTTHAGLRLLTKHQV